MGRTPQQLIEKAEELVAKNKLEFIGCEPMIENYGRDKKGEWIILDGQKYYF